MISQETARCLSRNHWKIFLKLTDMVTFPSKVSVPGLRKQSTLLCMRESNRSLQLGQWPYFSMRCSKGILKAQA